MYAEIARLQAPIFLLFALGAIAGCRPLTSSPSVLLVSIDTLRRDHVSAYGYSRQTTPAIDAIARAGLLFEHAVSSSNWTLPAHASLLTGLAPASHHVQDERDRLADGTTTLALALRRAGYSTAGFASHVYLGRVYGFDRGFDTYVVEPDQPAEDVTRQALIWLDENEDSPFFLFLHYFDPHWNFDPPPPFKTKFGAVSAQGGRLGDLFRYSDSALSMPDSERRQALALYDGEIAYVDHQLGRVFDWLRQRGRLNDTVVAVVSDHGEEFGERGGFGHGSHLHSEVTAIPLIVRYPPRVAPTVRRELATLADLPATLLALVGLEPEPDFLLDGLDLSGTPGPAESGGPRRVVTESTRMGPKRFALHEGN